MLPSFCCGGADARHGTPRLQITGGQHHRTHKTTKKHGRCMSFEYSRNSPRFPLTPSRRRKHIWEPRRPCIVMAVTNGLTGLTDCPDACRSMVSRSGGQRPCAADWSFILSSSGRIDTNGVREREHWTQRCHIELTESPRTRRIAVSAPCRTRRGPIIFH